MRKRRRKEKEKEEGEWPGPSAAASCGMLASLASRQRGAGGGMLGSDLDTVSLQHKRHASNVYMIGFDKRKASFQIADVQY